MSAFRPASQPLGAGPATIPCVPAACVPEVFRVSQPSRILSVAVLSLTLAACTVPAQGTTPANLAGAATGALPLDVLAVTTVDAETQIPRHRIQLRWAPAPNARAYEVLRKLEGKQASVKATLTGTTWEDDALGAGQSASYKVQALSSQDAKVLTASDEKAVTVLKAEVSPPTGLKPENNTSFGVDETPTLSWERVDAAAWYYVKVWRTTDEKVVFSALTPSTSVKLGDRSPLALEKFPAVLPVEGDGKLDRGVVHRWTVSAVRTTGGQEPARVTALEHRPSELLRFSIGG